jgi:hypothetical protein
MRFWWLGLFAASPCLADSIHCHIIYGGENFSVTAEPTTDPYRVAGNKIGRYFEFRITYVVTPSERAGIRVYVYGTASGESVLIHEVKYPATASNGPAYGFSGFHTVYEPTRSSEFQYWCEKR